MTYPKPLVLTEDIWTVQELRIAIGRLQLKESPDQCGVSAELFTTCPRIIFVGFASDLQFRVGGWGRSRLLADNLFPHVAEKIACYACN